EDHIRRIQGATIQQIRPRVSTGELNRLSAGIREVPEVSGIYPQGPRCGLGTDASQWCPGVTARSDGKRNYRQDQKDFLHHRTRARKRQQCSQLCCFVPQDDVRRWVLATLRVTHSAESRNAAHMLEAECEDVIACGNRNHLFALV